MSKCKNVKYLDRVIQSVVRNDTQKSQTYMFSRLDIVLQKQKYWIIVYV